MRNSLPLFLCLSKSPSTKQPHLPRLLKGLELIPSVFVAVGSSFFPLGKVGMGLRIKAMFGWFIVDGMHLDNAVSVALS